MTLQEHLGHTGSETEITVDLEGRMSVKEVGICPAIRIFLCNCVAGQQTEHITDDIKGMIAVEHTSPEVYLPSNTPSRSHVATLDKRVACSLEELGIEIRRNLIAGI